MKTFRTFTAFCALATLPGVVFAQSYGGLYGNGSGNHYNTYGNGYSGYNANTGSRWNAQSYGGITRGTDSRGDSWSYDNNSGIYQNDGTGEIRTPIDRLYNGR
ncbi:hypothetical protein F2Q65_17355 [Thiohalocapsa marina]|uniref:Uncharacterized protein n=1 Tax=Thiohalocapsa marina TaxID=424902 RepID=A0A5M8FDK8_9GAMM|nr:hypothetical protein [Thiohalocapsa marina]KAA6182739.1 hypothetical protein F2Q65_17355 [Thiohalocapsa marina]